MSRASDLELRLLLLRERLREMIGLVPKGQPKSGIYSLTELPTPPQPADGIAMAAIVKNEALYLPEWLEFHLMLGVRHIYLYDNGSTDNSPEVLTPFIRAGLVTVLPWRNFSAGLNPQALAYNHALGNFGSAYQWMAFIDIDEFLYPVEGDSLVSTMQRFNHLPGISLPWICFGPGGHKTKPDGLVIESYFERASFPYRTEQYRLLKYKAIVNPVAISGGKWPHLFYTKEDGAILINDNGVKFPQRLHKDPAYATGDYLRLHHYITRSHEEMAKKLAKGRVDARGAVDMGKLSKRFAQYELHVEEDRRLMRFVPELKRRLAERYGAAAANAAA
ncbi:MULTISPECIES: glycosyltransferase family 92 protein [Rhodomicrobium]|uniref:glycosyltransferase family 92 protein n=1 Tax=Rhodomicrobium TaxID=1068 RepID=UPI000F73E066|nr:MULTISPECIES: glycosyltransferase family 92 protein [Rhodomicrobium]